MKAKVEKVKIGGTRVVKRFLLLEKILKCIDDTLEWRWLETVYILQRYYLRHNIDFYWHNIRWATYTEYETYRKTGRITC